MATLPALKDHEHTPYNPDLRAPPTEVHPPRVLPTSRAPHTPPAQVTTYARRTPAGREAGSLRANTTPRTPPGATGTAHETTTDQQHDTRSPTSRAPHPGPHTPGPTPRASHHPTDTSPHLRAHPADSGAPARTRAQREPTEHPHQSEGGSDGCTRISRTSRTPSRERGRIPMHTIPRPHPGRPNSTGFPAGPPPRPTGAGASATSTSATTVIAPPTPNRSSPPRASPREPRRRRHRRGSLTASTMHTSMDIAHTTYEHEQPGACGRGRGVLGT